MSMRIIVFPGHQGVPQPAQLRAAPPLAEVVVLFLVDFQLAGKRPLTAKRHGGELRRYGRWLDAQQLTWSGVADDGVLDYARTRAHLKPSTQAATVGALKAFYAWAVRRQYIRVAPTADLTSPRRPKPAPKALTRAQLRVLLAELDKEQSRRAARDAALVLMGLYTGLRARELADLCWSHLDLDEGVLTIELSKMNHGRGVALHGDLVARLRTWKQVQALGDDAPCFADVRYGKKINADRVGKIVRRVGKAAGIKDLHTHRLRHSFATWTLRESGDLYAVSKALGHKALAQTEIYIPLAADVEQIAAAVRRLPGLAEW
jgi:site-specific recombinase XerC